MAHNKKIKPLTSFAGTQTCGAASPLCPTCLRPLFKSYMTGGLLDQKRIELASK